MLFRSAVIASLLRPPDVALANDNADADAAELLRLREDFIRQRRIDGKTIREATFVRRSGPEAWSLWKLDWRDATPGVHTLVSRAVDSRGQVQPEKTLLASSREDNSQWPREVLLHS